MEASDDTTDAIDLPTLPFSQLHLPRVDDRVALSSSRTGDKTKHIAAALPPQRKAQKGLAASTDATSTAASSALPTVDAGVRLEATFLRARANELRDTVEAEQVARDSETDAALLSGVTRTSRPVTTDEINAVLESRQMAKQQLLLNAVEDGQLAEALEASLVDSTSPLPCTDNAPRRSERPTRAAMAAAALAAVDEQQQVEQSLHSDKDAELLTVLRPIILTHSRKACLAAVRSAGLECNSAAVNKARKACLAAVL